MLPLPPGGAPPAPQPHPFTRYLPARPWRPGWLGSTGDRGANARLRPGEARTRLHCRRAPGCARRPGL